jgi:hypothetical protein
MADWKKTRSKLIGTIIRIPGLSRGAKLLWIELALNWCWNSPECCPQQQVLALALETSKNRVRAWSRELKTAKLLDLNRSPRGYHYTLVMVIPDDLITESWRLNNAEMTRRVKNVKPRRKNCASQTDISESDAKKVRITSGNNCASHRPQTPSDEKKFPLVSGKNSASIEAGTSKQERRKTEEKHYKRKRGRAIPSPANRTRSEGEERHETHEGKAESERESPVIPAELPEEDSPRDAGSASESFEEADVTPTSAKSPEDVLRLLRAEIKEKYGSDAARRTPVSLSGRLKAMVRSVLIDRYEPQVVTSMIRVLVWDWEIARVSCFPFRPQVKTPTIESLVQYQETLASVIDSGFSYTGGMRGAWDTYARKFLANVSREDPF